MDNNLFNFDFVKAKTGKVLTKVISITVQFFIIFGVGVFFLGILKLLWNFLIS